MHETPSALISDRNVEAVYVATPHPMHHDLAVVPKSITPGEARAAGVPEAFIEFQEWLNLVGAQATPAQAHELGLSPIDFHTWGDEEYRTSWSAGASSAV